MEYRTEEIGINRHDEKDRADYQAMYYSLFQDVTDAIEVLKASEEACAKEAVRILESGQYKTEEIYMQLEKA